MSNTEPHRAGAIPAPPPQHVLMQMPLGMWAAQAVATAARLGIADALTQSQPQVSTTLARAVGADAAAWPAYSAPWPASGCWQSRARTSMRLRPSVICSAAISLVPCATG
jgi:hypothetical protein